MHDRRAPQPLLAYEPALDGLRGVAILAVMGFHAAYAPQGGWAGVDIFFVLSGYLITRLLMAEQQTYGRVDIGRFYMRRALRLLPALTLLLLAQLAYAIVAPDRSAVLQSVVMTATYTMNFNRAFGFAPDGFGTLGHTWSLAMEEQFYLLWPWLLLFLIRRRPLMWIGAAIAAIIAWRTFLALHGADPERTYNGFDTHSDALLIGCAVALMPLSVKLRSFLAQLAIVPAIGLAAMIFLVPHRTIEAQTFGLTAAALCTSFIMIAAMQSGVAQRALSAKLLTHVGRISYGLYLWHFPILKIGALYLGSSWLATAGLFGFSYLVALASYRFVEMRFLRLKDRFAADRSIRRRREREALIDEAQGASCEIAAGG